MLIFYLREGSTLLKAFFYIAPQGGYWLILFYFFFVPQEKDREKLK